MKDPTMPDSKNRKKIMFYENPERQTAFRIRCNYDGLSQSQFFRLMIRGYTENNKFILNFLDECKEKLLLQGIQKRDKIKRFHKNAAGLNKKFSLEEEEIQNIFDVIEMETDL